jgi:hypothetical protein
MRRVFGSAFALAAVMLIPGVTAQAQGETSKGVAGGGITAAGWEGKVDANEASKGMSVKDAKFAKEGAGFHVTTGPATTYWNPANKASGDYTVKATFTESKYMGLNDHPHPYGIMIAGNDLSTDSPSYLYCEAYGNGKFIVRGMGPASFKLNGGGEANAAVHKAAGPGESVTQEIAMSVKGDKVTCSINGAVVGTYEKASVIGAGKLKSTDGVYGIRFAHNTDATVTGFTKTTP